MKPIAWAIAPAALLFLAFFVLPLAVMAVLSVLSGNPVSNILLRVMRSSIGSASYILYFRS